MTPDEKEVYDMKLLLDENDNWKHILIDAGVLMTNAEEQLEYCIQTESDDFVEGMRWVLADVANAMRYDEVDAVPIVRCQYCRWGKESCGNIECFADTNVPPEYHGYDWFCPNGERKA